MAQISFSFPPEIGYAGTYRVEAYASSNPSVLAAYVDLLPPHSNPVNGTLNVPFVDSYTLKLVALLCGNKIVATAIATSVDVLCLPPVSISISSITGTSATVTINTTFIPSAGYTYSVYTYNGSSYTPVIINAVSLTKTFNLTGLIPGTTYVVRVAGFCTIENEVAEGGFITISAGPIKFRGLAEGTIVEQLRINGASVSLPGGGIHYLDEFSYTPTGSITQVEFSGTSSPGYFEPLQVLANGRLNAGKFITGSVFNLISLPPNGGYGPDGAFPGDRYYFRNHLSSGFVSVIVENNHPMWNITGININGSPVIGGVFPMLPGQYQQVTIPTGSLVTVQVLVNETSTQPGSVLFTSMSDVGSTLNAPICQTLTGAGNYSFNKSFNNKHAVLVLNPTIC